MIKVNYYINGDVFNTMQFITAEHDFTYLNNTDVALIKKAMRALKKHDACTFIDTSNNEIMRFSDYNESNNTVECTILSDGFNQSQPIIYDYKTALMLAIKTYKNGGYK